MADYRDPKVSKTDEKKDSAIGKWIGIAAAVLIALLLLGWLLGWFTEDEPAVQTTDPAVTEEPATETQPDVVE